MPWDTTRTRLRRWLSLPVVLTAGLIFSGFARGGTLTESDGFCNAPDIPSDLKLAMAVEGGGANTDREVHLHGLYRIGLDPYSETRAAKVHEMAIRFDDADDKNAGDYAFRLAIAPHDADSVDLYLFNGLCKKVTSMTRPIVSASSVTTEDDAEQHIYSVLSANTDYCVQIAYTTTTQAGTPSDSSGDCATVLMELAVQPEKKVKKFVDACEYDDGSVPSLPNPIKPHDENDNNYYFEHDSTRDDRKSFWAKYDSRRLGQTQKVVAKYPIDLPRVHGRNQRWKIWASIQSRFLDSGDLTMILTAGDDTQNVPSPALCSPTVHSGDRNSNSNEKNHRENGQMICWFGTRAIKNHVILQSELWSPSKYTLWLILNKRGEGSGSCVPFSLDLKLFPLPEKENFVTCDIDSMPHSFNVPGMYNEATGTMAFSQDILVNLTRDRECATIRPTHPNSLLRAFVGAHANLDLDISLEELQDKTDKRTGRTEKQFVPVATSSRVSGPDAVMYVLKQDVQYQVCVIISHTVRDYLPGQDHDFYDFCDDYDLRVDVFPLSEATGSVCQSTRKNEPRFEGLQQVLDRDGEFRFGVADYSMFPYSAPLDLNSPPKQQELFKFEFDVKAKSSFRAIAMPVDPIGTPVVLTLYRKRKAFDDSDVTLFMPVAYGEPLTIGQKLGWTLEQGTYKVEMSTSPLQLTEAGSWGAWLKEMTSGRSGKPLTTAVLPTCVNYNFELILTRSQQCLDAIPLPSKLSPTAVAHRHIDERFAIENGLKVHSIQLRPDDSLKQSTKRLISHFLVSRTDVPVTITIYDDNEKSMTPTPLIVSQSSPSGPAELFATLDSKKEYRAEFVFNHASASSESLCRSMQLQVSVVSEKEDEEMAQQCEASSSVSYSSQIITLPSTSDHELGPLTAPYDFTGSVLKMEAVAAERKGNTFTRRLHFSTAKTVTFRLTAEYEFPTHIVSARVCKCTPQRQESHYARSGSASTVCSVTAGSEGCFTASGYYNGVQVPAIQIPAGDYAIELKWSAMSGSASAEKPVFDDDWSVDEEEGLSDTGDHTHKDKSFCALVFLQFSIADVVDPVSALSVSTPTKAGMTAADNMMCDPELQYLPKSLNAISYVWAGYNDEVHFYQNLLVPLQHESDVTKVKLTKPSLLRISLPSDEVRAVVIVTNDASAFSSVENGFAVSGKMAAFSKLEPGSYTITIGYHKLHGSSANGGSRRICTYLPFELSIIPVASANSVLAEATKCTRDSSYLPEQPRHERDKLRYRDLARVAMKGDQSYSYTIPFTIEAQGGYAMFDLRYNFPMGGLNVALSGALAGAGPGGSLGAPRRLSWSRRTNRAYFDRELPAGSYNLTIFDPVDASSYQTAGVSSSCVAFSLHMRALSYASDDGGSLTPPPRGGGNNNGGGVVATPDPALSGGLTCPYTTYDVLPARLDFTDTDEQTVELSGTGFPIPFASTSGSSSSSSSSSSSTAKKTVSVDISIPARSGYTVRAIATTRSSASIDMQLIYDPTDTQQNANEDGDEDGSWAFTRGDGDTVRIVDPAPGGAAAGPNSPQQQQQQNSYYNAKGPAASVVGPAVMLPYIPYTSVVASSRMFGATNSLAYTCSQGQCDNNGRFRLRLTFTFDKPPRYLQDYDNCMRKFALDSYRLFLNVHAASVVLQGTRCSDTQLALLDPTSKESRDAVSPRLPPQELTIGQSAIVLALPQAFITDSDCPRRPTLYGPRGGNNANMPIRGGGSSSSSSSGGSAAGGGKDNGPSGEGPSNAKLRSHISFNTTLIVPEGVKNATAYLQMRYNSNFMNLKVEVFRMTALIGGPSGTRGGGNQPPSYAIEKDPIYEASGNPSYTVDRQDNTDVNLLTSPLISSDRTFLQPGRYFIRFSANLPFLGGSGGGGSWGGGSGGGSVGSGSTKRQLEYCLPVSIYFMVVAAQYLPATNPPRGGGGGGGNKPTLPSGLNEVTTSRPATVTENRVVDFSPRQLGSLDPSEPFSVSITFSTSVSSVLRGLTGYSSASDVADAVGKLAFLQESDEGRDMSQRPHRVPAFEAKFVDERTMVVSFLGTKWMTTYRVKVDGTLLKPRDTSTDRHNVGYDATIINMPYASSFTTTWCSCDRQGLCVGGGGCGCTEVNGESCNTCQDGWELSRNPFLLANGIRSRLCMSDDSPLPPAKTHPSNLNGGIGDVPPTTTRGRGGNNNYDTDRPRATTTRPKDLVTVRPEHPDLGGGDGGGTSSGSSALRTILAFLGVGMMFALAGLYASNAMKKRARRPVYAPLGSRPDSFNPNAVEDEDEDDDDDDIIRPSDLRNQTSSQNASLSDPTSPIPARIITGSVATSTAIGNANATTSRSAAVPIVMGSVISETGAVAAGNTNPNNSGSTAIPMVRMPTNATPTVISATVTSPHHQGGNTQQHNRGLVVGGANSRPVPPAPAGGVSGSGIRRDPFADADEDDFFGPNDAVL